MIFKFNLLENEVFSLPISGDGFEHPLCENKKYSSDIINSGNQINPVLFSNKGRVIFCENGIKNLVLENNEFSVEADKCEIKSYGNNLKQAYMNFASENFEKSSNIPPELFFKVPQYNTWIELMYNQNQVEILEYSKNLIENDFPAGILMIDDCWTDYYGKFEFNAKKFPNPKEMMDELHSLGFTVMLWVSPFITADSPEYRELRNKKLLIRNKDENVAIRQWWNGYSAVLDLSNPDAVNWFEEKLNNLMTVYGVDGFKFDAGDPNFYHDDDLTFGNVTALEQCEFWGKFGAKFEYNEFRATYKNAGAPLVQRLRDKRHSWGNDGVLGLIPNALTQGILGYCYNCPDMIGGGDYESFLDDFEFDSELFIRYMQCSTLMPMLQFSASPVRLLNDKELEICKKCVKIHVDFADYILELAKESLENHQAIIRFMDYEFPNENFEKITSQFMLGSKYLVAPVVEKSQTSKTVYFPKGTWKDIESNEIITGGKAIEISAPLEKLPIFEKIN